MERVSGDQKQTEPEQCYFEHEPEGEFERIVFDDGDVLYIGREWFDEVEEYGDFAVTSPRIYIGYDDRRWIRGKTPTGKEFSAHDKCVENIAHAIGYLRERLGE
jgi:hypothetical protein